MITEEHLYQEIARIEKNMFNAEQYMSECDYEIQVLKETIANDDKEIKFLKDKLHRRNMQIKELKKEIEYWKDNTKTVSDLVNDINR